MNTVARTINIITGKDDVIALLRHQPQNKCSITTVPTDFKDAAKAALLRDISAEIIARARKTDVVVVIVELPQSK